MTPQDTKLQAALERLRGIAVPPDTLAWLRAGNHRDTRLAALAPLLRDLLVGKGGALELLEAVHEEQVAYAGLGFEDCPRDCPACAFLLAATEALDSALPPRQEA